MSQFSVLINAVLPVLGVVMAGFAIRRLDWLSEASDASLMRVVVNLLTPCLIADTILGNPAFGRLDNLWLPPLLGFGFLVSMRRVAGLGFGGEKFLLISYC